MLFEQQAVDQAAVAVEEGKVRIGAEIGEVLLHVGAEPADERAAPVDEQDADGRGDQQMLNGKEGQLVAIAVEQAVRLIPR